MSALPVRSYGMWSQFESEEYENWKMQHSVSPCEQSAHIFRFPWKKASEEGVRSQMLVAMVRETTMDKGL